MTQKCLLGHVSGRVQGVFFRGSAQEEARRLGLRGYAMNLPDGRVQILVSGPEADVDAFQDWVAHGPPHARVDHVAWEVSRDEPPAGFQVR
ncbi:acylphosphatase [Aquisalimonas asiatica]|uniref:Acylphosphatase n=1 Tax=Aquisalimonas asiatica TaxID=406100 RepID=A0A1H8RM41_9GAMM|nr:acylphosphatase [Aquisalimonas asiatica]SEO67244.1 acylphosphatase [Aquisalimonas asiatica]